MEITLEIKSDKFKDKGPFRMSAVSNAFEEGLFDSNPLKRKDATTLLFELLRDNFLNQIAKDKTWRKLFKRGRK